MKDHPKGIVCLRGAYSNEGIYSPNRINDLQVRVEDRGEGRCERVSWDEALDRVAAGTKEVAQPYGA